MVYPSAVQYGSHQPHMATEHLKCGLVCIEGCLEI